MTITHASSGTITLTQATALAGRTPVDTATFSYTYAWTDGTGKDQADLYYIEIGRTVATSTTDTFDLAGTLTDYQGTTITCVKLKEVKILITSEAVGDILVIGAGSNPVPIFDDVTDTFSIGPGGLFHLVDPSLAGICTVTAGTGDILTVDNTGANTVTYSIALVGTSA